MGFNFPDAPLVGQLYTPANGPIWQWDGEAWKARKQAPSSGVFASGHGVGGLGKAGEGPLGINEATIGDVLPVLGDWNGQLWWESDTGRLFIWFDDGTSSQWVQIIAPIILNEASGALVTATGGVTPRALADWFAGLGRAEDPPKLGFWTDMGPANVWRFRDRIFVGTANTYDGRLTQTAGSWLGEPEVLAGDGNANQHWLERSAQFYSGSVGGGVSILGSTRTSDKNNNTDHTPIAVAGYAYANVGLTGSKDARGGYFEAVRGVDVLATAVGLDVSSKNLGDSRINNSYDLAVPGSTFGLRLASGGDPSLAPVATSNSSAALVIGKNATRWNKGIIFDSQALEGTDVAGNGKAIAIELARGQAIKWRYGATSNTQSGEIRSDNYDLAKETRVVFDTTGLTFKCLDTTSTVELTIAQFPANGGASIYPSIEAGAADIAIRALGLSIDADIRFIPKGFGRVIASTSITACDATPIESGGSGSQGLLFSATPDFGVFFGSDHPVIPAASGSLYLRSNGEANQRTYVNIGSGWIPLLDDISGKLDMSHIGTGGDSHALVIPLGNVDLIEGSAGFMDPADKLKLDNIKDVLPDGISGLITGTDKTKLDGIVDVIPNGPSGLMPGVDKAKLDGLLPVVPDGIPGLMVGADKVKLDGLTAIAPVTPGGPAGLMSGADKTRLDGFADVVSGGPSGFMLGSDKARLDSFTDVGTSGPSGFMTSADKARFDGIVDVVPNGPSGLMTGTDKARFDDLADVTPGGISGLMTGPDKTRLDSFDDVIPGGVSGFMTGTDKTKLDAIVPVLPGTVPGLMSGEDKTKLDAMVTGTGTFIDRLYTTAGTTSWVPPVGVIGIDAWVQAGGGGGGGATAAVGESAAGSGGGGGGYGYKSYDAAALASMGSVTVVVGNGGAGGVATNGIGGNGGTSSFGSLSCNGGIGGNVLGSGSTAALISGGAGGQTASGAQVPVHGSSGGFAIRIGTTISGAGGGAGGTAGGGCGGASPAITVGAGVAGFAGAGGSGGFSNNGVGSGTGGAGGVGFVKVREYY